MQKPDRKISSSEVFIRRPKWFLITRYFAVIGVALALLISRGIFHIETLHYTALWILTAILLVLNMLYCAYLKTSSISSDIESPTSQRRQQIFTIIQINADLIILTLMLHFSGGAANPFIFYYFFHTMLSSILLSKKTAYIEACIAALLFCSMTILEGVGVIPHYDLMHPEGYTDITFIAGMCFALTSALLIAAYMATSIVERLRQRQFELEHALEETARLETEKSRFLDIVAHDLKAPLASIETMITSYLAVHSETMSPELRQVLERIPIRTQNLLKFIQELLDYSQIRNINQLRMKFKPLDIIPIVSAATKLYTNQALSKNITLTFKADSGIPQITGNSSLLEHMVSNLISNAIQYTSEHGTVTLRLTPEDGSVVLTVSDTGIGIPEQDIPNIFNDFFRARNARKYSSSGTGLGLSITKTIVEKHNGSINLSSTVGKGTVFTIQLPSVSAPSSQS